MTTLQVEELLKKSSVALIPMGPTEVHGFYLPLCTDIETGIELAERTARKLGERGVECLITPAVPYCIANGLHAFAGNTTTRPETVKYLISDICTSLAKWGFRNILIGSIERRKKCKSCEIYDYCNGGCSIDALAEGKMEDQDFVSCKIYKGLMPHIKDTIDDILENKPDMNQFNGFVRDAVLGKLINPQIYDASSFQ